MMIIVNRIGEMITGTVNGKQFGVAFDATKFDAMKALETRANSVETMDELRAIVEEFEPLTKESYKELIEAYPGAQYIVVNKSTNRFYLKYGGKVSREQLPQAFVDRIIKSVEKGIDIEPLIKCWARFMRPVPGRPAYTMQRAKDFAAYIDANYVNQDLVQELVAKEGLSHDQAILRATTKQVAITQEGLLVAYKVSTEIRHKYDLNEEEEVVRKSRYTKRVDPDTGVITYEDPKHVEERLFQPCVMGQGGDAFWCERSDLAGGKQEGHFIRVGAVHYLDNWDKVSTPGSKGLHCGGLAYIAGYQSDGTVTHNIFVDPSDIHTVRHVGTGLDGAMTVRRYFVHSTMNMVNKNIYHASKYAALLDAEYAALIKQIVEATEAKKEELLDILGDAQALVNITSTSRGGEEAGSVAGSI